jgi:pyruvate dehydrogenase E2 component (dihydrolipoamide acetyltransferase)
MEVYESMREGFLANHGHRLTVNILMLKVLAEGIKLAPRMNARIDLPRDIDPTNYDGTLTLRESIDVAAPWHLPNGATLSLNMRDCGNKSLAELAALADDLQSRAEATDFDNLYERMIGATLTGQVVNVDGQLNPEDMIEGSITVSNIGSICKAPGKFDMLVVIAPQTTAIGISSIQRQPRVCMVDGEERILPRSVMPITIAFDHRAMGFYDVTPFIERIEEICAEPEVVREW